MVLYATIARKGQGSLPFVCLESGRVERGEGRKKKTGGGGGGDGDGERNGGWGGGGRKLEGGVGQT